MRVTLLTSWMSKNGGGVFEAVFRMAQSLHAMSELELSVFGLEDKSPSPQGNDWKGVPTAALPTYGPSSWGYSPKLLGRLTRAKPDLLHVHGLWMYPSVASRRWSRATRRQYVVTPHGMLDPWAIGNSGWKKSAALWAYEKRHLEGAACLHALCDAEAEAIRGFGLRNPICIVPNSVDVSDMMAGVSTSDRSPSHKLLYLGRLHPKKGLVNLLNAWHQFRGRRGLGGAWELVIAGWNQGGHEGDLRRLVDELGIRESVRFPGPTFGADKASVFRHASAFVLPSMSEGLPMAVLEAWSYGLPVLMTPQCNFPKRFAAGAALYIEANCEGVLQGLQRLAEMSDADRQKMGARGLQLCRDNFSPAPNAAKMTQVYRWLTGGGPEPSFVQND
jgi:glycosyltransferase involved in cell wall biosynthesis